MYRYNWSLIFIHLAMIGQLVLAVMYYKKHPPVSICMFIYFAISFLFIVTPYSFSYDHSFGRFVFGFLHIINIGVITLAIFGWRDWQSAQTTQTQRPVMPGESMMSPVPVGSTVRIEPGFYWSFFGLWIAGVLVNIVSMIGMLSEEGDVIIFAAGMSVLVTIPMAVLGAMMLYRAWASIQDGHARTTPGKAVGFCFIPFFNLYWIFVGFGGLAKDMNAFARRYNLAGVQMSEDLFSVQCVLVLLNIVMQYIPVIGNIYGIAIGALGLHLFRQICTAVNAISDQAAVRIETPAQSTPATPI
jgi:hypothetical protein